MSKLQLPSSLGGLDFPDIKKYQLSSFLSYVVDWVCRDPSSIWLDIEASQAKCPLINLLFLNKMKLVKEYCRNPITINTVRAWRAVRQIEGNAAKISPFTPITGSPDFQPGIMDSGFKLWISKGIFHLGDLFDEGTMMSFSQIVQKFNIPNKDLFRFFQIRDYIQKKTSLLTDFYSSDIEKRVFCSKGEVSISTFYSILRECSCGEAEQLGRVWEEELGVEITAETWEDICDNAKKISVCNRTKALQLKILHRAHLTPDRLSKFKTGVSPMCSKCKVNTGTFTHCFWTCPKLQAYWSDILGEMEKILKMELELDPVSFLLGLPSSRIINAHQKKLFNILTFCARKNILLCWISDKAPGLFGWRKLIMEYIPLDFLTCMVHSKTNSFHKTWQPFLQYVDVNLSAILIRAFV